MSGHVRITDFISCISVFNDNFCWLKERVKELKKDMRRLEEENKILKSKVDILEAKQAELKGRMIGWQNGFSEEVRRQFKHIDDCSAILESLEKKQQDCSAKAEAKNSQPFIVPPPPGFERCKWFFG